MNYDITQQIELVLKGDLAELLKEKYGSPPYTSEQIKNSVDFTRAEALEHVTEFGFPPASYTKGGNQEDGIHLDKNIGMWKIWYSEKGGRQLAFENSDPELIKAALMDLMIYLSGLTGTIHFTEEFDLSPLKWK
jgi:hypothetical protein